MKFSFGKNWLAYSTVALDERKIAAARKAFRSLTRGISLRGARFLDIGFGQGLPLFLAAEAGADVYGIDIDPVCEEALAVTHQFFPSMPLPPTGIASVLDEEFVRAQEKHGLFDVVYSWGVLHHTGDMLTAFRNAAALVKPGGYLIISIYNRHWTSPLWRLVKCVFNHLSNLIQNIIVFAFYPVFYLRAWSLSQRGSLSARGMDLRHDIRDWLGGHPYEYASVAEVQTTFSRLQFRMLRFGDTRGFTGCNEFVLQKAGRPKTSDIAGISCKPRFNSGSKEVG
jgi:SAM-dependent methyltransferase